MTYNPISELIVMRRLWIGLLTCAIACKGEAKDAPRKVVPTPASAPQAGSQAAAPSPAPPQIEPPAARLTLGGEVEGTIPPGGKHRRHPFTIATQLSPSTTRYKLELVAKQEPNVTCDTTVVLAILDPRLHDEDQEKAPLGIHRQHAEHQDAWSTQPLVVELDTGEYVLSLTTTNDCGAVYRARLSATE